MKVQKVFKGAAVIVMIAVLACGLVTPAMASGGQIQSRIETGNTSPLYGSVTPQTQNVSCVPDGTATATWTITATDVSGGADMYKIDAGSGAPWAFNTTFSAPVVSGNQATWTATTSVNYNIPAGAMSSNFRIWSNNQGMLILPATLNFLPAAGLTIDTGSSLDFGVMVYAQQSSALPATMHNVANTVISISGTTPNWASDAGGSAMPASALKWNSGASTISMATGGVTLQPSLAVGSPLTASMWVVTPANAGGFTNMAGNYTTTTTLTAASL